MAYLGLVRLTTTDRPVEPGGDPGETSSRAANAHPLGLGAADAPPRSRSAWASSLVLSSLIAAALVIGAGLVVSVLRLAT